MPPGHRDGATFGWAVHLPLEPIGLGLVVALATWAWLVAARRGGDPRGVLFLLLVATCSYVGTRWVTQLRPRLLPQAIVVTTVLLVFLPGFDRIVGVVATGRLYGPLGYANASGLLFLLAAVCAVIAALVEAGERSRRVWLAAAVVLALLSLRSGSVAVMGLLLVVVAAMAADRPSQVRTVAWSGLVTVLLAVTLTVWLGVVHAPRTASDDTTELSSSVLSERRLQLWHDAVGMVGDDPVTGIGPGRFRHGSVLASSDQDAFTPHNAYLLVASELGLVGAAIFAALVLWSFAALGRAPTSRVTALAAAAVTVTLVHATVDYVLRAPAIVIVTAAVIAWAPAARLADPRRL